MQGARSVLRYTTGKHSGRRKEAESGKGELVGMWKWEERGCRVDRWGMRMGREGNAYSTGGGCGELGRRRDTK